MRLKELASSVSDTFHLARKHIVRKPGFNLRFDFGQGDEWKQFVHSILANGIIKPISGFKDDADKFVITDGDRRITALDEALGILQTALDSLKGNRGGKFPVGAGEELSAAQIRERIAAISIVPCTSESKGTTDEDRLFSMAVGNTGKPFNLLENALLYGRLMADFAVSPAEIQRRTGITRTAFDNAMLLLNAPEVHEFIRKGHITPTLALEVCRKVKDRGERVAIIQQGIETAKAQGKGHATAKHLNSDVRTQVAPSTAKPRTVTVTTTSAMGKSTFLGNGGNEAVNGSRDSSLGTRPLDPVLTNRSNTLLSHTGTSSLFNPKWKIEGSLSVAMNRENKTWFYSAELQQGKTGLSIPWSYGLFGSNCPRPDATTRGFDEEDEALHQAYRALRAWLVRNPARHTDEALAAVDAAVAKLNGHGGEGAAPWREPEEDTHARNDAPATTHEHDEAPAAPSDEEAKIGTDLGDQTPGDSDAAFDGILRVLGDVASIGGVKKRNERFATLHFVGEYLEGRHTHNQLKAFVLYGSAETRSLTTSER